MVNVISGICKFTYWRALTFVTMLWSDNDVETWISILCNTRKNRLGHSEIIWHAFLSTVKQYFFFPIASPVIVSLLPWHSLHIYNFFWVSQSISCARRKTFFKNGLLFRIWWVTNWIMVLGIFSGSAYLTKALAKDAMKMVL